MNITEELFRLKDEKYRDFQAKLIPTVEPKRIIGVRMPLLRKLAKEFAKMPEAEIFMTDLPHKYYEENNVHMLLISEIKDFDKTLCALECFLSYVDNWSTCDMPPMKVFKDNPERLLPYIKKWLKSEHTYTVRYGIKALLDMFLDERFDSAYPELVSEVKSDEYYVNMMIAWYFATALAKQYDAVLPYITEKRLDPWVHNKAIQKAMESFRIDAVKKSFLKKLKR